MPVGSLTADNLTKKNGRRPGSESRSPPVGSYADKAPDYIRIESDPTL